MAIQVLQNPYLPAPETGFGQAVDAFKPYLDMLTMAMLQGGAAGAQPTGKMIASNASGKSFPTYAMTEAQAAQLPPGWSSKPQSRADVSPFGARFREAISNQLDPNRTARALEQYKLQSAPYELQKLQSDIANQQALGSYYQSAARSLGRQVPGAGTSAQGFYKLGDIIIRGTRRFRIVGFDPVDGMPLVE